MIDPQARPVLDELKANAKPMPRDQTAWLKTYREELDPIVAMQGPPPAIATLERMVPISGGATIGLRLDRPGAREVGHTPTP